MTQWQHERRGTTEDAGHPDSGGVPPGPPAPFPALINLTIPAGTILGWSAAPGEAGSWGLLDPGDTRRLLQAASLHPRTRWCFTLLAPDGTAAAHGCARGSHPWIPPPDSGQRNRDGPDTRQAAALATLLRDLNVTFTPIAKGSCDHTNAENRYTPSRKLGHLIRARTATCPAPGCGAHAYHGDLDHTVAAPGRAHRRMQHRPALQTPPPRETSPGLEAAAARTRRHDLDHTLRTHLHHQAHRLRDVIQAIRRAAHDLRLLARQEAIKRIEHKRRYWIGTAASPEFRDP